MSDFRKPRPDIPIVPREALYRTERPTFFKRPKGRRGRKTKGKKVGKFVASQDPNFKLQKERDEKRKSRELVVSTAQRRQQLDVAELEDIKERRQDRPFQRQLALDQFALQAGIARRQGRFQGRAVQLIQDVAGRIEDRSAAQLERGERDQQRLYAELRAVYDRGERRAGERERMMVELVDRFTAGGGRVDRGDLLALDERVRIVERSQTPASRRSRTPGAGRIEEVSTESDISDQDFDLPTPGSRRKRRERRLSGRGSPRRPRTPTSSETEREQFRRSMSGAVLGAQPEPEPEPEPLQTARSPSAPSPQEERRKEFLETGTSGGGSVEREQRSPSVEISTQTEPAQTARRIVSARKLTPAEQDARARVIVEQARVEIREAEEDLAEDAPQRSPKRPVGFSGSYSEFQREAAKAAVLRGAGSPKRPVEFSGSYSQFKREAAKHEKKGTPRERRAEERFYQRQSSPASRSPSRSRSRERDPEAEVVEQAVERLESPGIVSDALGAVARGVGGVAQGAAEGVVSALPSAEEVGKAVGRGVVGVAVKGLRGAKAVAQGAGEAVIGAVAPEPEPAIGQQTGAPLVPRKSGEEQLFEEVSPYEQLLSLRQPKNQFLFKESKRGTKKSDHPINLGTETYGKKFRLTDHGGKIGDAEPGRPYLVYSMGGSGTQRKDQIGFVEEAYDEKFEEGERIFGNIKESKLRKLLDSEELELELSD